MPPLYGFWLFLKNNPVAQAVGAVLLFFALKFGHAKYNQRKGRLEERERAEERAKEIQYENREALNEKSAQTNRARDSVQPVSGSASVPSDLDSILFGDEPDD